GSLRVSAPPRTTVRASRRAWRPLHCPAAPTRAQSTGGGWGRVARVEHGWWVGSGGAGRARVVGWVGWRGSSTGGGWGRVVCSPRPVIPSVRDPDRHLPAPARRRGRRRVPRSPGRGRLRRPGTAVRHRVSLEGEALRRIRGEGGRAGDPTLRPRPLLRHPHAGGSR